MGLKLRYNLFYAGVECVYDAFDSFYKHRGSRLQVADGDRSVEFYRKHNGWTVVQLDMGWEWRVRREAQLFVSRTASCPGFLVFVYDGDYWGYEFFDRGKVKDHYVQWPPAEPIGFPGEDCRGNPQIIAEHLPFLRAEDISPYLVRKLWDIDLIPEGINVPARPGDEFRRFDECAVIDFLRMLGVAVERRGGYVRVMTPLYQSVVVI